MKIIVTGGAGFIGGNFIHHMVNKYPEYQIVNLDLLTYAGNLETLKPVENKPNYKFVKGDIADRKFVFDLFEKEKPDIVVNFAAESHVDRSVVDPESLSAQMLWELQRCLTHAALTESSVTTRFPPMRFTEIFRWTARISSSQRRHRSTPPARTLPPRQALTFSFSLTTEPTDSR